MKRKPYKQFMFHFRKRNSIDARNITLDEIKWCRDVLSHKLNETKETKQTIFKMFKIWFPEYLVID